MMDGVQWIYRVDMKKYCKTLTKSVNHFSRIVNHSEIKNSENYYTISSEGVTHVSNNEAEFTPLKRWAKEYEDYKKLIQIKTFEKFRIWKAFAVWRKNVRTK
jgi:dynein heavy chain